MAHPSLHVYQPALHDFIHADFEIETLDSQCLFTEGPIWHPDGFYLFSDITGNCVYRIAPGEPRQVYIAQSGTAHPDDPDLKPDQAGSNGLAFDGQGNLLVCQHGGHGIAVWKNGRLQPFLSAFEGKPFNSPNDIIVHENGTIWFSDPPYGLKDGKPNPERYQSLAAVYCWKEGSLTRICERYQYPNGVCLSPDGATLYICSNKPFEKFISTYDTTSNRFLSVFAEENSDGIETDPHGNVYLSNRDGLLILDRQGRRLGLIALPTIPANHCWGGPEGRDLFITARQNVFLIRNLRK